MIHHTELTLPEIFSHYHDLLMHEKPRVPLLLPALHHKGLEEVFDKINEFINQKKESGRFIKIREQQAEKRFQYWVQNYILEQTKKNQKLEDAYNEHKKNASDLLANPSSEARDFVNKLLNNPN